MLEEGRRAGCRGGRERGQRKGSLVQERAVEWVL